MEWVTLEFIWKSVMTVGIAAVGFVYRDIMAKFEALEKASKENRDELHRVQINYVHKDEIKRIEERIDVRFGEMREFFTTILGLHK